MPLPYFYRLICCVMIFAATACGGQDASEDGSSDAPRWPNWLADTNWTYSFSSFGQDKEARLRLYKEGEVLRAKYNVGLYGELYDYQCEMLSSGTLKCVQVGDIHVVKNIYASMVAQGKECDAATIKSKIPHTPDSAIEEGLKEAKAEWEWLNKNKNKKQVKKQLGEYKSRYTSGTVPMYYELFINRGGSSEASLNVIDHHFVFFKGRWTTRKEEVGNSDFKRVPDTGEKLFWEDCELWSLLSRNDASFPTSLNKEPTQCYWDNSCTFSTGDTVHYGFFPFKGEGIEVQEGCSYSIDFSVDARLVEEGKSATTEALGKKEVVSWTYSHAAGEAGTHIAALVMKTSCPGKEDEKKTACTRIEVR